MKPTNEKPVLIQGFTFSVVCPCNQVGLEQQAGVIEHIYAVPPSTRCAACVILFHSVPDLDCDVKIIKEVKNNNM